VIFAITLLTIIRELIISGCGLITDCSLSHIAHNCPDLEVLRINGCRRLTSTSLLEVAVHCPNLYGIPPFANEFDLSQSNKDLSAARCRNINEGVTAIARDCKLRQLDLYLIKEVGDSLMSSGKCHLYPHHPRHSSPNNSSLLLVLNSVKERMEVLYLSQCKKVTNVTVSDIARYCPDIKVLFLNGCPQVTDLSVIQVVIPHHLTFLSPLLTIFLIVG